MPTGSKIKATAQASLKGKMTNSYVQMPTQDQMRSMASSGNVQQSFLSSGTLNPQANSRGSVGSIGGNSITIGQPKMFKSSAGIKKQQPNKSQVRYNY